MAGKLIVGLTGIFGSGKSTVAHLFEELGAAVVDADKIAHEALGKGSEPYKSVAALFPEAKNASEELDRKVLAGIIFKDVNRRKALEKVVHPYVLTRIKEEIAEAEEKIVVLEVPLLFEAGVDKLCDVTVVVTAQDEQIQKRLEEKGFSPAEIQARLKAQMSLKEKVGRADFVLENASTLQETKQQVEKLWREFRVKV